MAHDLDHPLTTMVLSFHPAGSRVTWGQPTQIILPYISSETIQRSCSTAISTIRRSHRSEDSTSGLQGELISIILVLSVIASLIASKSGWKFSMFTLT